MPKSRRSRSRPRAPAPADGEPPTPPPPGPGLSPFLQGLRFSARPMSFNIGAHRRFGDVWMLRIPTRREGFAVTCHPDHLQSLLKASPGDAPSLTGESPLRPILDQAPEAPRMRNVTMIPRHGCRVRVLALS